MTLNDKFSNLELDDPYIFMGKEDAKKCQLIAEEFAIGFAEFCSKYNDKNRNVYRDILHAKSKYDEAYTTKELLEIHKKEKGL